MDWVAYYSILFVFLIARGKLLIICKKIGQNEWYHELLTMFFLC